MKNLTYNSQTLGNVAIASAITSMARVHMSQFLNNINLPVYYMDTDCVVVPVPEGIDIPDQLFDLVGDGLGKMKLVRSNTLITNLLLLLLRNQILQRNY